MRIMRVKPENCVPMPELERAFYDQTNYFYLKRTISQDGYNSAYPVRAIYNEELKKPEVFDGIHRIKVGKELRLDSIPLIIEDLTRAEALAEGYKANRSHAWYNTIDKAKHLKSLADEFLESGFQKGVSSPKIGRPRSHLHAVSKATGEEIKTIKNHLSLLTLPSKVQEMVGKGSISYSVALEILKLKGAGYEHLIPRVAEKAAEENWSKREAQRRIQQIKDGIIHDFRACDRCGKGFPKENVTRLYVCPFCLKIVKSKEIPEPRDIKRPRDDTVSFEHSKIPFTDSVNELKEKNRVREKMGLEPIKRLRLPKSDTTSKF